jgi:shikimate kinase
VRAALRGHEVVWLDVEADVAWKRASGPNRPLASDHGAFALLHAARDSLYAGVATATVLPGADPVAAVAALADRPAGTDALWARGGEVEYPVVVGEGVAGGSW